jgi:hypothetical protein
MSFIARRKPFSGSPEAALRRLAFCESISSLGHPSASVILPGVDLAKSLQGVWRIHSLQHHFEKV